jgi:hypothetical protein
MVPVTSKTREREGTGSPEGGGHSPSLRSRSGGEQWKREANDGWECRQDNKVRNPQSGGTWGQFSSLGSGEGRT